MSSKPKGSKKKKKGLKKQHTLEGDVIGISGVPTPPQYDRQDTLDGFIAQPHEPPPPPVQSRAPPGPPRRQPRAPPTTTGGGGGEGEGEGGGGGQQLIEKEITLPHNAKPGMKVSVSVDGSEAKFTLPHGAKPGMKIKVKIKRKAASTQANLAHDTHRSVDDRGNFIRPAQAKQAPPRTARDVVNNVRGETSRMFGGFGGRGPKKVDPVAQFFEDWAKWEMCELLVLENIELKDIAHLNVARLRSACARVFRKKIVTGDLPKRPQKLPLTKMLYMESLVRKVQERWFKLRSAKAHAKMLAHAEQHAHTMRIGKHGSERGYGVYKKEMKKMETGVPSRDTLEDGDSEMAFMDRDWEMPRGEAVEEYINETHPRIPSMKGAPRPYPLNAKLGRHCCLKGCGEQLDLWDEGKVSEFAQFGAGIVLYFKFIKVMYWVFITLSVLFLPTLLINTLGDGIPVSILSLGSTTIGNLGGASNFTQMYVPGCETFKYLVQDYINIEQSAGDDDESNCVVDKGQLGIFYGLVDVVAVLILLFAVEWLKEFEAAEVDDLDRNTVDPSDFTIYLPWVPPEVTEADLKKFFAQSAPEKPGFCGSKPAIKSKPVYLVFFGHDDGDLISAFKDHGDLEFEKYIRSQKIRFYRTRARLKNADRKVRHVEAKNCCSRFYARHCRGEYNDLMEDDLVRERKHIITKIEDAVAVTENDRLMAKWQKPIGAFVSFFDEETVDRAMTDISRSFLEKLMNYFGCCVAPHKVLRIGDKKYFLNPRRAFAPSTIVWENYRFSGGYRARARMTTNVLSAVFIMLSIIVRGMKEAYDFSQEDPNAPDDDGYCAKYTDDELAAVGASGWSGDDDALLTCYCTDVLRSEGLQTVGNDKQCRAFAKSTGMGFVLELAGVAVIAVSNIFIMILINRRAKTDEKHHSLDGQEVSVMSRGFFSKFLNTGLIFLILGLRQVQAVLGETDLSNNLDVTWYETIAPDVIIISVINILAPHGPVLFRFYKDMKKIAKINKEGVQGVDARKKTDGIYCQDQLDKLYLGPDFHLHIRYIQLLVNFYMVMLYGMGIPLLFPIAAVQFFVTFWFDKIMFIRYYRKPPQYDYTTGKMATELLGYGVMMHLVSSIWMLTNPDIFTSNDGAVANALTDQLSENYPDTARFFYNQSIVMTVLLAMIIVFTFVSTFLSTGLRFMAGLLRIITCSKKEVSTAGVRNLIKSADDQPITYPEARKRGLIHGLDTYNILINPIYRDMFRIPLDWVRKLGSDRPKHKHVWSVKKFDPEHPDAEDDADPEADAAVEELGINREQYNDFKDAFDSYDKNQDGSLDHDEIFHAMRSLGYDPTDQDVDDFMREADKDENGVIDFPEFVQMMQVQSATADNDEIKEAFEMFDKNGDGCVSGAELRYMMASFGRRMTDPEIDEMLALADTNGDKEIDYNEFIALMTAEEAKKEKKDQE